MSTSATRRTTKLTALDTKGVAVVTRGANGKRIALAKGKPDATIEEIFLEIITKGEMAVDEAALEAMCQQLGLDEQQAEAIKAILRIKSVYADDAKFAESLMKILSGEAQTEKPAATTESQSEEAAAQETKTEEYSSAEADAVGKADWDTNYVNNLPDSAFLYVEDGGEKDEDNKTIPRTLRHFPYRNANGAVDLPHLRNALARIPQSDLPAGVKEKATAEAQRALAEANKAAQPQENQVDEKQVQEAIAKAAAEATAEANKKIGEQEAVIKAQKEAIETNAAIVKKMQDDMRTAAWVTKAEKDLRFVPGKKTEELVVMLKSLEDKDPETANSMFETLKAASSAVEKSSVLHDAGIHTGSDAGGALDQINKATAEKVAKADDADLRFVEPSLRADIKKARAMAEAMRENKSLYTKYLEEQKR